MSIMDQLSADELKQRLKIECKARRWRVPSPKRLKKLREAGQLPKAVSTNEKGKRGRSWRYDPDTVAAYVRAEEARRSSGKRVRSWKLIEHRERRSTLLAWFANPDSAVPRDAIAESLIAFSELFRGIAPALYPYVEHPVGPSDDDRLEGAHTAIEAVLDSGNLCGEARAAAEALLRVLIFRDEAGNADDIDLAELLESLRQRAGPFSFIGGGLVGICNVVREIPLNEFLTSPRTLLDAVTDEELRESVRALVRLFQSIERVANVAAVMMSTMEKARSNEAVRGDLRLHWYKPIAQGTTWIVNLLQSELGATLLCASALVNIWRVRKDPGSLVGVGTMAQSIDNLASLVEQASQIKKKTPSFEHITTT